jgi:hypothetical protein
MNATRALLIEAKRLIENDVKHYVCHALTEAGIRLELVETARTLRYYTIPEQIDGHGTLESYLSVAQKQDLLWEWDTDYGGIHALMRMAWLDKMILEAT